jgi:predicted kinase
VGAGRGPDNRPHADSPGPGGSGSTDLRDRLAKLDARHPSGLGYDAQADRLTPKERAAADARYAEHVTEVAEALDAARKAGLVTDRQHTIDDQQLVWTLERSERHDEIILELYDEAAEVPCEGKAILAGGLPGAGKTTVLTGVAGIDLSGYLMINPDGIKERMAARGLVPDVAGLSPMEASELVHEESSYIAKQLALRAYADRKNVIWDVTMSSLPSTQGRVTELRSAGYGEIEGIFVDIPVEVSVRRAAGRHREGYESYFEGRGLGGRYLWPDLIRAQTDPVFGSANRATFERVKPQLDRWRLFDNSVDGRSATLVEEGVLGGEHRSREERNDQ